MRACTYIVAFATLTSACSDAVSVGPDASDLGVSDFSKVLQVDDLPFALPAFVYVSGYSTTIARYRFDEQTGALTAAGTTTATGSPSFLAADPSHAHLYAVDEANSRVEAYAITAETGALTHIGGDPASGGSGPAHLTVDATGQWVLVANYGSGHVGILRIGSDGTLAAPATLLAGAHAHEVVLDATNHFAWVPCLGSNYVAQYAFSSAAGSLTASTPATVATPAGSGPRHLAVHPTRALAYLIEETDSMIGAYTIGAGANLALLQRLTTRAAGASGNNTGAEVQVHPSGNFVYVSNRGDDDFGIFAVAGTLTPVAHVKTGGQTPRHFSIDPLGRWLFVANQDSGDVRVFAINQTTGMLTPTGQSIAATMPSFVGML
jgi:6-phosphogluconolactonase